MIHLSGGTVALRKEIIEKNDLRYNEHLRSGFEDALFISEFLLRLDVPRYEILPQANLYYLSRPDSLMANSGRDFAPKAEVAKLAYSKLLQQSSGDTPQWLANVILYDLYWIFKQYLLFNSPIYALPEPVRAEYELNVVDVLKRIGIDNIRAFRIVNTPLDIRAAWEACAKATGVSAIAIRRDYDSRRAMMKVVYHSSDPQETCRVEASGRPVEVVFHKSRSVQFFKNDWVFEHILWLRTEDSISNLVLTDRSNELAFELDGRVVTASEAGRAVGKLPPRRGKPASSPNPGFGHVERQKRIQWKRRQLQQRLWFTFAYRLGRVLGWNRRFASAWVLIDRLNQANDNAEALYRYLKRERPDINSWFVLDKSSPDYGRLQNDGFRMVPLGSWRHYCLMKEASVLTSSMIDEPIVRPFPRKYLPKTWLFSFLQHGVTKDNLHRWLNMKNVDHFVTATIPETESISGSPGPYKFSEREVALTGFPRHDRLYELTKTPTKPIGTTRIVIMPTWRKYLEGLLNRENGLDEYRASEFVQQWQGLLTGHYMSALCERPGIEVILLPHPGIDQHWKDLKLPAKMQRVSYLGDDIQDLLSGADVVVTDYSSQAFEGAFCHATCVYFQFDRDEFFAGGHIGSTGYFDYERDGFGPVCSNRVDFEETIQQVIDGTHPSLSEYRRRIEELFPWRDGNSSKRVVASIEERMTV